MKQVQHNLEVFTRDFATPIDYEIEVTSKPEKLLKGIAGAVYVCLCVAASATVAALALWGWL
jgi:hypothetical protein